MYSRNFLNEIFRDGFLLYNDIFAVRTRCVRRENGSSISKIQPKGFVWRRYREYIHYKKGEDINFVKNVTGKRKDTKKSVGGFLL